MEIKCSKFDIVTEKKVFDQVIEQSIDADFSLPEYLPEISRVLKCTSTPMLLSKSNEGSTLTIEGEESIVVIYSDNTGNISSFEYVIPFTKIIELPASNLGFIKVTLKTNYLNYRPTGKRKMDIHGAIGINICALYNESLPVITDLCGCGVEVQKEKIETTCPCGYFDKSIIIDEELILNEGAAPISSIIRYKANANIDECKIISGKIITKGELCLHTVYLSEEVKGCQKFDAIIPFTQIIDAAGTDDACNCEADVTVSSIELKPRANSAGDVCMLNLEAKLCIIAKTHCEQSFEIITDTFSTLYESEQTTKDVYYNKLLEIVEEKFICKKALEFTEGSLSQVVDMWCEVQTGPIKQVDGAHSVSGTVTVCILGYDSDETAVYFEKPLDFTYPCKIKSTDENLTIIPSISASDSSYILGDADKLEVRVELTVKNEVYVEKRITAVTDTNFCEDKKKASAKGYALVIYYPTDSEHIWDIAKRYNTSVDSIKKANGLECDRIPDGKMLLIPCV
ncbi:MAG: DUF3794 domain-containing protein [Clostridia bacterium]|nr:DUF3794 domain-containing protein [Clostridia bacterium]